MKIAVVGANGKAGKLITEEAINSGFVVSAIVRNNNKTIASQVIQKDLFDLNQDDVAPFDVIVNAFGQPDPHKQYEHSQAIAHLTSLIANSPTRFIVVGGAGSLYVDADHKIKLIDTPEFPEQFKATAQAQGKTLEELKNQSNVQWTFVSPAPDFQYEGNRTGEYRISNDEVIGDYVSYADFAIAIVDEIANAHYVQQRFAVFAK